MQDFDAEGFLQDDGWAVDAVRTDNFRDTPQTGQACSLIQGIVGERVGEGEGKRRGEQEEKREEE